MGEFRSKIAYLKGLAEGLGIANDTKEGKVIGAMIDVMDEFSLALDEMAEYQEELENYIETIDHDLGELEEDVYGFTEDHCCEGHHHHDDLEDEDEDENDNGTSYVEVECPQCHDVVRFEASILADDDVIEVTCPNCDEVVYINDDTLEMLDDKEIHV